MIIVDTMVLSEPLKPRPDPGVIAWLDTRMPGELFTTTINRAEMEYGLWGMPDGGKRARLHRAIAARSKPWDWR